MFSFLPALISLATNPKAIAQIAIGVGGSIAILLVGMTGYSIHQKSVARRAAEIEAAIEVDRAYTAEAIAEARQELLTKFQNQLERLNQARANALAAAAKRKRDSDEQFNRTTPSSIIADPEAFSAGVNFGYNDRLRLLNCITDPATAESCG